MSDKNFQSFGDSDSDQEFNSMADALSHMDRHLTVKTMRLTEACDPSQLPEDIAKEIAYFRQVEQYQNNLSLQDLEIEIHKPA